MCFFFRFGLSKTHNITSNDRNFMTAIFHARWLIHTCVCTRTLSRASTIKKITRIHDNINLNGKYIFFSFRTTHSRHCPSSVIEENVKNEYYYNANRKISVAMSVTRENYCGENDVLARSTSILIINTYLRA